MFVNLHGKTTSLFNSDDSDPNMILFLIDANLEKLELTSFSVKLTGLASQCWILALHLGLNERTPAHQFPSRFNLQSMNQMLEASGAKGDLRLSDKAKEFKQLFETFQKSQSGSALAVQGSLSPAMLMAAQGSFPPAMMTSAPHIALMADLYHQKESSNVNGPKQSETLSSEEPSICCKKCAEELKNFEERITKKMDDFQKIQSDKLDKILVLLDKSDLNKS